MLWHLDDARVSELAEGAEATGATPEVAAAGRPVALDASRAGRHGQWWDLDVQFGYAWPLDHGVEPGASVGLRSGITLIRGPWFLTGGAAVRWPVVADPAFGAQVEAMHIWTGLWAQPGVEVELSGRLNVQAVVGWSVLGIEVRHHAVGTSDASTSLGLRARIPIGLLVLGAKERALEKGYQPDDAERIAR